MQRIYLHLNCNREFCHSYKGDTSHAQLVRKRYQICASTTSLLPKRRLCDICCFCCKWKPTSSSIIGHYLCIFTSGKINFSLNWPDIMNIKTRFDPLMFSTFDAPCTIVRANVKVLLKILVIASHM